MSRSRHGGCRQISSFSERATQAAEPDCAVRMSTPCQGAFQLSDSSLHDPSLVRCSGQDITVPGPAAQRIPGLSSQCFSVLVGSGHDGHDVLDISATKSSMSFYSAAAEAESRGERPSSPMSRETKSCIQNSWVQIPGGLKTVGLLVWSAFGTEMPENCGENHGQFYSEAVERPWPRRPPSCSYCISLP